MDPVTLSALVGGTSKVLSSTLSAAPTHSESGPLTSGTNTGEFIVNTGKGSQGFGPGSTGGIDPTYLLVAAVILVVALVVRK